MIKYAFCGTSIGTVLVAVEEFRIVHVTIGEDRDALETPFKTKFPTAEWISDRVKAAFLDEVVCNHVWFMAEGMTIEEEYEFAQPGTPYQQRVWAEVVKIPRGETRTYAQIAEAIGSHPRPVARACSQNSLALVVPCHRVVGAGGSLKGYKWGIERKEKLLSYEQFNHVGPTSW